MDIVEFQRRREDLQAQVKSLTDAKQRVANGDDVALTTLSQSIAQLSGAVRDLASAEEELRAQHQELTESRDECERERERYQDLFEFCPDAYLVTQLDGVISEANRAAADLTGRAVHELLGKSVSILIPLEEQTSFMQRVKDVSRIDRIDDWHVTIRTATRRSVNVAISVHLSRETVDGEGELRWLIRDLSSIEEAEAELQVLRQRLARSEQLSAIGTLAAGLGHDVKNLVFPMRCRLDSLSQQDLPEQAMTDLLGLRHAVAYLQQLANNLQLLSERPDESSHDQEVTDLAAWWDHVQPLLHLVTRGQIQLEAEFEDELPPLRIAPHLLTQATMNLVNNVSEVMPQGGRVWIEAVCSEKEDMVQLSVKDDGPGMQPQVLRRALDPFYTTKTRRGSMSTGMGLPLVRGIVRSVAGSVRIDSAPGEGTVVMLRLPVACDGSADASAMNSNVPHAAISVSDSHLASTLATLLHMSRLPSYRCDPHEPGDSRVWIVEPHATPLELAREYLRKDKDRRLVLYGDRTGPWRELPATCIESTASLARIRDTLSEIALDVLQPR